MSAISRSRSLAYSTFCTGVFASIAIEAAVAALWPSTMNTGSIRIDPYAICVDARHTGTSRFVHSLSFGVIDRYDTG